MAGVAAAVPLARRVAGQESTPGASPAASPMASPGASPAASAAGVQADGTWAFTDDKGVAISLPAAPERIVADVNAAPETFWETLSMEQALKYPADVVFHSSRLGTLTAEEIQAHPTLGQHPVVQAGQIGGWNQDFIMSYQGMTLALQEIMAPLANARKIT